MLNLRKNISLAVIMVMLLPLILINVFFIIQSKNYLNQYGTKEIESVRSEKIQNIKMFYEFMKLDINSFSNIQAMNYFEKGNSSDFIDMSILKNVKYIENVYILDGNFNSLYTYRAEKANDNLSQVIKQAKFAKTYYISDFYVKDGKSYQFIFNKVIKNGEVIGFVAFEFNSIFFDELLNNNNGVNIDIYNGNFTIVASTFANNANSIKIDQYTKKMLSGDTNTEISDGIRLSYSFIDLEDNFLYIIASKNENLIYSPINDSIIYLFIFFMLSLVFTVVIAVKVIYYIEKNIKATLLRKVSPEFNEIFNEIVPEVEETMELIDNSVAKLDELKEMKSKLLKEYNEIKNKEDKINEKIKNI